MTAADTLGLVVGDGTPVVAAGSQMFSRGDVRTAADALSARLREAKIDRLLVRSDNPFDLLRAIQASQMTGADLWIAHTSLPPDFIDELTSQSQIQLHVGDKDSETHVPRANAAPAQRVHMMTSGTTGRPKIAIHTLDSLLSRVRPGAALPANREGRWLLAYQPTGFAGIQVLLTAVLSNGLLVVPEQRNPSGFFAAAKMHQVTQISATATFWRSLLMVGRPEDLPLRQITLGGEAVDQATLSRLKQAFPAARITHIYASTEAGVVFAVHDGQEGFPAVWLKEPTQGVQLRLRDGRLQIKTPRAMQAYTTEDAQPLLDDGWLATADECEVRGDRVIILGRKDSTINVAGSKVYPLAVEKFLLGLEGVREARVFGVPNPVAGAIVGAEVVIDPERDPNATKKSILKSCREGLPGYQVPRAFKIVDAIQVKASGKKG